MPVHVPAIAKRHAITGPGCTDTRDPASPRVSAGAGGTCGSAIDRYVPVIPAIFHEFIMSGSDSFNLNLKKLPACRCSQVLDFYLHLRRQLFDKLRIVRAARVSRQGVVEEFVGGDSIGT